jgi:hypothetical protein
VPRRLRNRVNTTHNKNHGHGTVDFLHDDFPFPLRFDGR